MARKKKIIQKNISSEDFNASQHDYANAEAKLRKLNAQMDLSILKIRERHAAEVDTLTKIRNNAFDTIHSYCEAHRDTLFDKRKSIATAFGSLGYRLGTPKLKTLKGFTWKAVLQLLKSALPDYIRTREDVNKEALLADRDKVDLNKIGCYVDSDETFFIDVKEEVTETQA